MLSFIAAVYNEEKEVVDLLSSIFEYVEIIGIVDDGSTDKTAFLAKGFGLYISPIRFKSIEHTGLPETVKAEALNLVPQGWVLMLDADERISEEHLKEIRAWIDSEEAKEWDYVYFDQYEFIDDVHVRTFQKCKLFRKDHVKFPLNNIHADDVFEGMGFKHAYWSVIHSKTTYKQIQRETEYLATYKKLLDEGKIDQGRYEWLCGLHHFVKPSDLTFDQEKAHNEGTG